jgi:glycosyltransferase 2 family protein
LRKWIVNVVALLSVGFFIYYAVHKFDEIPVVVWSLASAVTAVFSVVLVLVNIGLVGVIWKVLLLDSGIPTSWKQVQIIIAISQFGKYLPGNIGQHVGRVVMARDIGIPMQITLSTMLLEMIWGIGVSACLSVLSMSVFDVSQANGFRLQLGVVQLSVIAVFLLLLPWLGVYFLNRYFPRFAKRISRGGSITAPRLITTLWVAVLFLLCFMIMGLILKLHASSLFGVTQVGIFEFTCLFAVAWLAGYLVPGAPAGLGVREAMMLLLLTPLIGPGPAVGLGITLRVTTTIGDAVAFLLGILIRKFYP